MVYYQESFTKVQLQRLFAEIRFIKYITTLLYHNSINYDKKLRKYMERTPLCLDAPIINGDSEKTTLIETIPSQYQEVEKAIESEMRTLEEHLSHPKLYEAFQSLTSKQKKLLFFAYVKELSDTQIARLYDVSQQSVSKSRKNALIKLRSILLDKEIEQ